ncbi:MFS family permease [Streptosporangium becharense]|uniref:MFS family permease n=1 Tax=Streptosporangium becharense TaxID=1816182 RepID=A0A7W9ILX9_9ACTN|nr:MFS transporter [Streptosporangium becharense]MBB2910442.1 MFS family permease [Streptosporangium becharense]MBB5823185.1 MFS family permease [Streptosporangium becharense]
MSATRHWWMLAAIAIAQLTVVLEMNVMPIALPSVQEELGVPDAEKHWVISAYTLAFAGLYPLAVRVAGLRGRRRTFAVGMTGFTVASVVAGTAATAGTLLAARAIQGGFGAFLLAPANLAFIGGAFADPRVRARGIAVFTAVAGGGGVAGVVVAGLLTEYLSWRWCLFVVVPLAIFSVTVAWYAFGRDVPAEGRRHYDLPGTLLLLLGLGALVAGVGAFATAGPGLAVAVLTVAALLLAGFALTERASPAPVLPPRIVLDRNRAGVYLAVFSANIGTFGAYLLLSSLMQDVRGYSPLQAGLAFLPLSVAVLAGTAVAGRLLPGLRPRVLLGGGLALAGLGVGWPALAGLDGGYAVTILPGVLLMGLGVSWIMVPANVTIMQGLDPRDAGVATPMVNASTQLGGVVGAPLLTVVAAVAAASGSGDGGVAVAAAAGGALILLAAAVVFVLVDRGRLAMGPPPPPAAPAAPPADNLVTPGDRP